MFDCRQSDVIHVILIYFSDVIASFPGPTHLPSLAVWKVGGAYEQDSQSHHVTPPTLDDDIGHSTENLMEPAKV